MRLLYVFMLVLILMGATWANDKPNILVIWGDDIGWANISKYNFRDTLKSLNDVFFLHL